MKQTQTTAEPKKVNSHNVVKYNRWGYIFLIPFIAAFIIYNLVPLGMTVYYSFFEYYKDGGTGLWTGPNFISFDNYKTLITGDIWKYAGNTAIMWILGFIPQILVSLLLAQWFSDSRLRLRGAGFFKTVIYLPNLIMASAFAMLFASLFAKTGPINASLVQSGALKEPYDFLWNKWSARGLVALMNFLMWFGNTTILLMAGILGIDTSLYEAAEVDGANSWQRFTTITLPLLQPILIYVVITSLIGGIQMYDVPQILTNGAGSTDRSTMTMIMYLNRLIGTSKDYGMGGALSVILFFVTGILSIAVYNFMYKTKKN